MAGTGFQSKGYYLFGHFSMRIKMVAGDSAGTVTAFYVSETYTYIMFGFSIHISHLKIMLMELEVHLYASQV